MSADFMLQYEGTIWLLHPLTPAAARWAENNLASDAMRMGSAYVIEHRYVDPIVDGIASDGLTIKGA